MKLISKNDLIVIAVILTVCVLMLVPSFKKSDRLIATITVNGTETQIIDLSSVDKTYTINTDTSPEAEITVEKNAVFFSYAECPDKLCINTGKLTRSGQTAACLPAKVVVSLKSEKSDFDVLTY